MIEVVTPAASYDLVTLENMKVFLELGAGTARDAWYELQITAASEAIVNYLGRFPGRETVKETIRLGENNGERFTLERWPVGTVTSVLLDSVAQVALTDYELDKLNGTLRPLSYGKYSRWACGLLEITYQGGYSPLPQGLQKAAAMMVKASGELLARETALKAERLELISSATYFEAPQGMPAEVLALLDPYKDARL
jgi:hypothetical protein